MQVHVRKVEDKPFFCRFEPTTVSQPTLAFKRKKSRSRSRFLGTMPSSFIRDRITAGHGSTAYSRSSSIAVGHLTSRMIAVKMAVRPTDYSHRKNTFAPAPPYRPAPASCHKIYVQPPISSSTVNIGHQHASAMRERRALPACPPCTHFIIHTTAKIYLITTYIQALLASRPVHR